ncbi:MAG: ABC transporter ATP-binding protein [Methanobacteriota archaeon]|nr:MAG: ABC transporter ATP-binding protein [Euryarchaeota archaeon]
MHFGNSSDRREHGTDASDWELLKFSMGYVKDHKYKAITALVVVILSVLINLLPELFLKKIFDEDIPNGNVGAILSDGGIMIGLYVFSWILGFLNAYLITYIGQGSTFRMRTDMFQKLMKQSMKYFETHKSGQINSRITNDVNTLSNFLGSSFIDIVSAVLQLIGIVSIMIFLDVELGMISLSIIPLMIVLAIFIRGPIRRISQKRRQSVAEVTSNLAENISGQKVSKAFAREKENTKEFEKVNRRNLEVHMKATSLFALIQPLFVVIGSLSTVILMTYTGLNPSKYSVGTVVTFNAYLSRFFFPVIILTMFYSNYQSALASLERIYIFLSEPVEIEDKVNSSPLKVGKGEIVFEDVDFGYSPDLLIFQGLSLKIEGGKRTAIVGSTGAGKSTLIKLIVRFYDPLVGRVMIDGQDLTEVALKSIREQIGLIPQRPFLFKGTIYENLTYGTTMVSQETVEEVAELIGLKPLISNLPNGYETMIEEGGESLSLGQRQLIAFGRVLIHNPKILILDEATSSMDSISELKIQKALDLVSRDRTTVIIAHRLSTIKSADRILVIEEGRIIEDGTHLSLLEKRGRYLELYKKQLQQTEVHQITDE